MYIESSRILKYILHWHFQTIQEIQRIKHVTEIKSTCSSMLYEAALAAPDTIADPSIAKWFLRKKWQAGCQVSIPHHKAIATIWNMELIYVAVSKALIHENTWRVYDTIPANK